MKVTFSADLIKSTKLAEKVGAQNAIATLRKQLREHLRGVFRTVGARRRVKAGLLQPRGDDVVFSLSGSKAAIADVAFGAIKDCLERCPVAQRFRFCVFERPDRDYKPMVSVFESISKREPGKSHRIAVHYAVSEWLKDASLIAWYSNLNTKSMSLKTRDRNATRVQVDFFLSLAVPQLAARPAARKVLPPDAILSRFLVPDASLARTRLFRAASALAHATCGRMLVISESWEQGWDADLIQYARGGALRLSAGLQRVVKEEEDSIERPWWGKLAHVGWVMPSSEVAGSLRVRATSHVEYVALRKALDLKPARGGKTLRETLWLDDLRNAYEASVLPHIICAHIALLTPDGKLLFVRRGRNVDVAQKAWSPSIEEQASDGWGRATEAEKAAYRKRFSADKDIDATLGDTVRRGLEEELGIGSKDVESVRCYALATDWVFAELAAICIARTRLASTELGRLGGHDRGELAPDPEKRIQYCWESVDNLTRFLKQSRYDPRKGWKGEWHPSARLRLFSALCAQVEDGTVTWDSVR